MRTRRLLLPLALVALACGPLVGQTPSKLPIEVDFDEESGVQEEKLAGKGLRFTVKFSIIRQGGKSAQAGKGYKVVIEEDGKEVRKFDLPEPKSVEGLSTVLAMDVSGSKDRKTGEDSAKRRIDQTRDAARVFLKRLPKTAECGLILFDHQVYPKDTIKPTEKRELLHKSIDNMKPRGGSAYRDAAKKAIAMLAERPPPRKKVLVLMTDGADGRSEVNLDDLIRDAKSKNVQIYTIGMGEPGKAQAVTSVLVLDKSASMEEPADDMDKGSKIVALRDAAKTFVDLLPQLAKTTVLPFGSDIATPTDFTNDKIRLKKEIDGVKTEGETKMLDAAYEAIAMLAADPKGAGKKAVVVMTDGIDNQSRMRPEDVIARAKAAGVTVHMLLFGKEQELEQARDDMKKIAKDTGGIYFHAKNAAALKGIFEEMSFVLHDEGPDEPSLQKLAKETGGEYFAARDINQLKLIVEKIGQQLPTKEYTETFNSHTGFDGRKHKIKIKLVQVIVGPGGQVREVVVQDIDTGLAVRGVVVPQMHPLLYVALFSMLVLMAVIPPTVGRMFRSSV